MKTRKRTQAAFAHPEISWSRNRSLRIVIRIQIQITKKKTSKATRSASPNSMSAKNTAGPFGRFGERAVEGPRPCAPTLPQRCRAGHSADDDLPEHVFVKGAVVAVGAPRAEPDRNRLARLDLAGREAAALRRRVLDLVEVDPHDPVARVDVYRPGLVLEVLDVDRHRPAHGRRRGRRSGSAAADRQQ